MAVEHSTNPSYVEPQAPANYTFHPEVIDLLHFIPACVWCHCEQCLMSAKEWWEKTLVGWNGNHRSAAPDNTNLKAVGEDLMKCLFIHSHVTLQSALTTRQGKRCMLSFHKNNAVDTAVDDDLWFEAWHGITLSFLPTIAREDLKDPGFGIWCFPSERKEMIDSYLPAFFLGQGIFAKCHLRIYARGLRKGHAPKTKRRGQWRTQQARTQNIFLEVFHAGALSNNETVFDWEPFRP